MKLMVVIILLESIVFDLTKQLKLENPMNMCCILTVGGMSFFLNIVLLYVSCLSLNYYPSFFLSSKYKMRNFVMTEPDVYTI